jgi:peroxiredoxin-like protein
MEDRYTYEVDLEWNERKKGTVRAESLPDLEVATPPEFPGGHEGIWSPEQLLVASVVSCIMNTFLAIAENSKLEFTSYKAHGTGTIEKVEKTYRFTAVTVGVDLVIPDESKASRAERILQMAEQNCFISNSLSANVTIEPNVTVG